MTQDKTRLLLEELAKNLYNVCKTTLAIYDVDCNLICAYPHKMCDFCTLVRTDPLLEECCFFHDKQALDECCKTHKAVKYYCHMGLVEVVRPIIQDSIVLGFLQFGQITDDKEHALSKSKIEALNTNIDKGCLYSKLTKVRYRSPAYIESISKILEMSVAYILLNGIFSIKTDRLAYVILDHIKSHLSDELSSDKLCNLFSISRTTLYNISKSYFGCGIQEYILHLRMERAKGLLLTTDLPISEIGEKVGINDPGYFSKRFKSTFGSTPKSYRNTHLHL